MKIFLKLLTILLLSGSCFGSALIDQKAPDFSLFDSYGKEISLNSFEGKKVVIEWTNHGCPFVAKHYKTGNMQSTQEFTIENDAIWLSVISSAPGTQGFVSSAEANELTAAREASPSHVLFDPTGRVGKMYNAKTTPHMYIVNKSGVLKYEGAIDDAGGRGFMFKDLLKATNYIKKGLIELSTGNKVSTPVTKPYGCSVKYAS
ncbi:MAG: redoxin domain-containing protein [Gammaproteobacteria bacterium]|nr:MAG: redoxin domain-containing protein [Gammaproteobacteria bacterium]|tara:strand:- start:1606 stop:2214 length:609 start_codon:yes stop_codon:yes gene_type:complete